MSQPYQSSKQVQPKVIAGIPAYNVAGYVSGVIRKARKYVSEVIVVDDGSTDSTAQVSRATGALVISHGVNRGYGEAVKSCFEVGRVGGADVLVTLDGDGQHNADEIQKVVAPIINKEADIVIGNEIEPVTLEYDEKWEQVISFTPHRVGANQKVEFLLYKLDKDEVYQKLHLWIDVTK